MMISTRTAENRKKYEDVKLKALLDEENKKITDMSYWLLGVIKCLRNMEKFQKIAAEYQRKVAFASNRYRQWKVDSFWGL